MPVFSLDNGRLSPARPSLSHSEEIVRETLMAVRDQVVELIYRPIFPVAWLTETTGGAGRHTSLVALDPSGKTVTVDVVEHLDTSILMGSLARASRHEEIPRGQLSGLYPRGATSFRKDWQEFLDSVPSGIDDHPRLIILAVTVDDQVRAALDSLVGASIEVHRIDIHDSRGGLLVSLEQVRPHEASFLAIGRAVRRGELSAPQSPSEAAAESQREIDNHSASEEDTPEADPFAPEAGRPASPTETADEDISADGVVFVDRGKQHRSAADEPASDDVETASVPDTAHDDETDKRQTADIDEQVADEVPADSPWRQAQDPTEAAAQTLGTQTAAFAPDLADESAGSAEAEGADETDSEDANGPETADIRDDSASDDDADQFEFRSVGFSPEGGDTEEWRWNEEAGLGEPPEVTWPERTTELEDVAARVGEMTLTFKSLRRRVNATARLTEDGSIVLENGDRFDDPDEAATAVAGRRMDGWKNWRTENGTRLGELRR